LSDFKSTSCLAPLSYVWLWLLVVISCAIYLADGFTAVNLLAFNNWSSQVKPAVPFEIAKWIFAITIIVSYVFLLYRYYRAVRVIKSGSVTECYLEPVAAIWQSMRMTKSGQGWRRFLVFAELTKSKKGANYIALFVYFQFKSALLVIVAQGPRTAINAMTLYAVMKAQLLPVGDHASKERSNFVQFFMNIKVLVETGNKQETVIYFSMLFSLLIWVIAALSLIISSILYITFLWHYIPKADGTLTQYCRRKVETRLERIVGKKVKKAIEKADQKRRADEQRAIKKGKLDPAQTRPTLPKLDDDDNATVISIVTRSDTMTTNTTLPPYSGYGPARTNTQSTGRTLVNTPLSTVDERPPMPNRNDTQNTNYSTASYRSNAPLLDQAGGMATATPAEPMPPLDPRFEYFNQQQQQQQQPPMRSYTPADRSYTPADRSYTPADRSYTPADRSYTPADRSYTPADRSYTPASRSYTPADRSYTPASRSYTPADRSYTPADRSYTPADRPFTPVDRQNTPADTTFTASSTGRSTPGPLRSIGILPRVDTSFTNNYSDPHMVSPLNDDPRGPPLPQSTRPYPEFSPFDSRGPQAEQSYELSPVDTTVSSYSHQINYSNSSILDEYHAPPVPPVPQVPSILRAGTPGGQQPQGGLPQQPRIAAQPPRAGTAPPPRAGAAPTRPGVPASLQSAIQRREASQPLPNRGMNGSVPPQRSATAPINQPSWNSGNMNRSYTPAAQQQGGYDQSYRQ
jgi:hypothetical protein